MHQIKRP